MLKLLPLKSIYVLFLLIFLHSRILSASENDFDSQYQINITKSWGTVNLPDILSDQRTVIHFISFDNGLCGTCSSRWKLESQAKKASKLTFSGAVNLVHQASNPSEELFSIVSENHSNSKHLDELWIERDAKFDNLNQIVSITENVEVIPHWFWKEKIYRYEIKLSEGTLWQTKPQPSPWSDPWEIGSRILIIGNSKCPCFINIDAVRKQSLWGVNKEHYLVNLELMRSNN